MKRPIFAVVALLAIFGLLFALSPPEAVSAKMDTAIAASDSTVGHDAIAMPNASAASMVYTDRIVSLIAKTEQLGSARNAVPASVSASSFAGRSASLLTWNSRSYPVIKPILTSVSLCRTAASNPQP